jgi:hypothetical protein
VAESRIASLRHPFFNSPRECGFPRLIRVDASNVSPAVELVDGRSLSVPLPWYPRLVHATPAERENWRLIGRGEGIHWPELDEDISVAGLLAGKRPGKARRGAV